MTIFFLRTSISFVFAFTILMQCTAQDTIIVENFETDSYGAWTAEGDAFGSAPAKGKLEGQQEVKGIDGIGFVNSFHGKDNSTGTLTSPLFQIDRNYLTFLIGGGNLPNKVGMELLVEGKRVRVETGSDDETLKIKFWDVKNLKGKKATLRIFDYATGGWGHVNVDEITATNREPYQAMRLSNYRQSKHYYKETYRPQFHFTPEMNWMNDPNGLVYFDGEYHLFYQHNPHGNEWGHMSWGHAVSTDLVHWKHLPIALHDEHGMMIFSGCCVIDWKNSSGFGKNDRPPMVAIYTGHGYGKQTQDLAYSNDNGRTWTKYLGNPVIDLNEKDFRDPKVFWHEPTSKWVMLVSLAAAKKLQFYTSSDLKQWNLSSEFGPAGVKDKPNWECPDLFELSIDNESGRKKWVLQVDIGGGAPAGGSGSEYFVGKFDGTKFICDDPDKKSKWTDYGRDFYAAVSFSDIPKADGRRIWIGWMNNWQTALLPTSRWRSAMSIPRVLSLRKIGNGYDLIQTPVKELQSLRKPQVAVTGPIQLTSSKRTIFSQQQRLGQYELNVEISIKDCKKVGFEIASSENDKQKTVVAYDAAEKALYIDRTQSGNVNFDPKFAGVHKAPIKLKDGKLTLHLFVDTSSVEVFANGGSIALTDRIFPDPTSTGLKFFSEGGTAAITTIELYPLKTIWTKPKN